MTSIDIMSKFQILSKCHKVLLKLKILPTTVIGLLCGRPGMYFPEKEITIPLIISFDHFFRSDVFELL